MRSATSRAERLPLIVLGWPRPHPACQHAGLRRHGPAEGRELDQCQHVPGSDEPFHRWEGGCVHGVSPMPQELRAKKIGRVIVDTAQDRPWSQYFCCMLVANREFVAKHPGRHQACCSRIPQGGRHLRAGARASGPHTSSTRATRHATRSALEVLKKLPYNRWREANPEDTLRFHALRLHEWE